MKADSTVAFLFAALFIVSLCGGCMTKSKWYGPNWDPSTVSTIRDRLPDDLVTKYEHAVTKGLGSERSRADAAICLYRHYVTFNNDESKRRASDFVFAAADSGNPYAQMELGRRYLTGDTVPAHMQSARYWLQLAKDAGIERAEKLLSELETETER